MQFSAVLQLDGKTATGITVPPEIVDALGAGKKPAVRVTINGHTYASTIATRGGVFKIPVSAENRSLADIRAGDEVQVQVELDATPRAVAVPTDFAEALGRDAAAEAFFAGLTASQQKYFVTTLEEAKTPETRARRLDKAISALQDGRKRP